MTVEVRGRGKNWKVFYPDEMRLAIPIPVFDRDGIFKETVFAGTDKLGMTEAHFVGTQEEAIAYAKFLMPGETDIKVTRTASKEQALEKARAAQARQRAAAAAEDDDV